MLIAFALSLIGINAKAFQVDDISYSVLSETDCTVEVVKQSSPAYSGDIIIPETVTYNDKTYTVTQIGSSTFYNCSSLNSVKLPNSINTIRGSAFYDSGITSIDLGNSVSKIDSYVFQYCESLTEIELPQSLTSLGYMAFGDCISLKKAVFLSETINFNRNIFSGCTSLEEVILPSKITTITERFFQNCTSLKNFSIPETVTAIDYMAFYDCSSLKSITIPKSVTKIESYAFAGCTSLESINLHDDITSLGEYVFQDCKSLKSIIIPSKLSIIPKCCFDYCESLTEIIIPEGVTTIESYAFDGCTSLSKINIPQTITAIKDAAFRKTAITSIEFPQNLTEISWECFSGCSNLTEFTISENVTKIGEAAFAGTSLTSITIPENVTSIGSGALRYCDGLTTITIPNSVTSIESKLFYNCSNLKHVKIGTSVKSIGSSAFEGCGNLCQLEIPEGVKSIGKCAFRNSGLPDYIELPSTITSIADAVLGDDPQLVNSYYYPKVVKINALTPPALGDGMSASLVIVPQGSGNAYKEHETWGKYNIVEDGTIAEVTVSQPGYLAVDIVEQAELAPSKVTKLIVHGKINQTDFNVMKSNMLGCYSIDLSDAECDTIPNDAFNGKTYLVDIKLPKKCNLIGNSAFYNCCIDSEIVLPEGLTSIGSYAFYDSGIKGKLTIPSTVSHIGSNAFETCKQLTEVNLSEAKGLKTINPRTFIYASRLQIVSLSESLESIGKEAFEATGITELVTPSELKEIGESAFENCQNLKIVDMSNSTKLTTIDSQAFWLNKNTSEIIFSESLERIGSLAFGSNFSISSITLPASLKTLGSEAFNSCRTLKYANLSKTQLTEIYTSLFTGCSLLEIVNLPTTITKIYGAAFYNCANLKNISVPCVIPPTVVNTNTFYKVDKETCVISIPTDSYVDYLISEHWGAFISLCKGIIVDKDENVDVYFRHLTAEDLELPHNAQQISNVKATSVADVTTPKEHGAIVVDGSSVYAKNNGYIKFILDIAEGYEIESVLYNDIDVTGQVVNNTYITPAVTVKGTLKVTTGIPTGIEQIETDNGSSIEAIEVARYDIHGRRLSEPTNGINIVKYSDGSTRKECVK